MIEFTHENGDYEYTGNQPLELIDAEVLFEPDGVVTLQKGDRFVLGNGNETGRILVFGKRFVTIQESTLRQMREITQVPNLFPPYEQRPLAATSA